MRLSTDDLPASESVSRLRASGVITASSGVVAIELGDQTFTVAVSHRKFPNGGSWSFYLCPCGRRCRILRLHDGAPVCRRCLAARGLRPRVQLIVTPQRAAYTAPKRIARLTSSSPARLHPRNGQMLDRRSLLEAALRRSLIVAREHELEEHELRKRRWGGG